jgi:acyl-coenzyme A synthetase/AMP-(fatty) acid ligase
MTETGMILSNPYSPMEARTAGAVGTPLPLVEVRLVMCEEEEQQQQQHGAAVEQVSRAITS